MMWLNRSTCMNSVTSTVPATQTFDEVVAGEVDEHEVLGLLLGVGEQLVGELDVAPPASRRAASIRRSDA